MRGGRKGGMDGWKKEGGRKGEREGRKGGRGEREGGERDEREGGDGGERGRREEGREEGESGRGKEGKKGEEKGRQKWDKRMVKGGCQIRPHTVLQHLSVLLFACCNKQLKTHQMLLSEESKMAKQIGSGGGWYLVIRSCLGRMRAYTWV